MNNSISIKNKKAYHEFFLEDKLVAGIKLTGTEIKSIRLGKVSLSESFCSFVKHELFVRNMHIAEYAFGTYNNHEPKRERKLLLSKKELKKLKSKTEEKGFTIIPTKLFINEKGLAKLEIAVGKGKKLYDKRDVLKGKDIQRQIERESDY